MEMLDEFDEIKRELVVRSSRSTLAFFVLNVLLVFNVVPHATFAALYRVAEPERFDPVPLGADTVVRQLAVYIIPVDPKRCFLHPRNCVWLVINDPKQAVSRRNADGVRPEDPDKAIMHSNLNRIPVASL